MIWRSSILSALDEHCPRALDFIEARTPHDRDIFDAGIAAHAVLDGLHRMQQQRGEITPDEAAKIAHSVATGLVTTGRSFDGIPEPPMSPARAEEGRDLAIATWSAHPTDLSLSSERGLAVDADWGPVPYGSTLARYQAACDIVGPWTVEEDGYGAIGLLVQDWKSAWPTSSAELETRQLRGQGLVAYANREDLGVEDPAFIRRRVVNLRTLASYEVDLWLDEAGMETLAGWRRDIELAMEAAEVRGPDGRRPARPGIGCAGCPWLSRCDAARAHLRGGIHEDLDVATLATRLVVVDAMRQELWDRARLAAANGPIRVPGGEVGFIAGRERKPLSDAWRTLAHHWFGVTDGPAWDAEYADVLGLLRAIEPGVGAIEGAAKTLYPFTRSDPSWRANRDALVAACTTTSTSAKFGIYPDKDPTND